MGYINDPGAVSLFSSVPHVLRGIKKLNYGIFVITNQSGISRGLIKPIEYRKVHERFISLIGYDVIDEILYCPHLPVHECSCRKPQSLLLEIVTENYQIDCSQSFFVGDKSTDVLCGKNFGLKTVLIVNNVHASQTDTDAEARPDYIIDSFPELLEILGK